MNIQRMKRSHDLMMVEASSLFEQGCVKDSKQEPTDPDGVFLAYGFIAIGVAAMYQLAPALNLAKEGVDHATSEGLDLWMKVTEEMKKREQEQSDAALDQPKQ